MTDQIAFIGVGNMGAEDLEAISSHEMVDVVALCDVDSKNLYAASKLHPKAKNRTGGVLLEPPRFIQAGRGAKHSL